MNAETQANAHRTGFTLIELLGALALSAMLLVALIGMARSMSLGAKELVETTSVTTWRRHVQAQLLDDLANARRYKVSPNELRLVGYGGSNPISGVATLRPTEIVYWLAEYDGEYWLVRDEINLDQITNEVARSELVCRGVARLALLPEQDRGAPPSHGGPLPQRFQVLFTASEGPPVVHLRRHQ